MVLTVYRYKLHRLAQYLQRIVQLDAFTNRHIRINRTMQQQQRSLDFIRIKQRPMLRKQIRIIPWIALGSSNRIIGISPIALTPETCHVTDAGM